jgi:UDP-N-acetylglucosamine acyltransferase
MSAWSAAGASPAGRPGSRSGNRVHPTAVVGPDVELGTGNVVGAYAVLLGPTRLGDDNWIGPHAVLGTPGESRGAEHPVDDTPCGRGVVIGSGNVFREFSSVHQGLHDVTRIGNACFLMAGGHVGHDVQLDDEVTVANAVMLGGHSWVGRRANLGLGTVVHQRSVIGAGAMVAMGAGVKAPVPPYATVAGSPARVSGVNERQALRDDAGAGDRGVLDLLTAYYRDRALPPDVPAWLVEDVRRFEARRDG